jgi:uncharacterized protein
MPKRSKSVSTTLPKHFDPANWLYEQLCLNIPFQKIAPDAPDLDFVDSVPGAASQVDKRWASLATLYSQE